MSEQFRTVIEAQPPLEQPLGLERGPIVLLGSCFADEMGQRLSRRGYQVVCNPFGPLFNPLSLAEAVERIASSVHFRDADLQHPSHCLPHVWEASASITACAEPIAHLNRLLDEAHAALQEAQRVFITLGTTRVFLHRESGRVVANCHKYPASTFEEKRVGLADTIQALKRVMEAVAAPLTATVSPVLHPGPGGLREAFLSKAVLRTAIEETHLDYFPAYEALACDLRDYRFYASDMRHPSEVGADYIFALFEERFLDPAEDSQRRANLAESRRKAHRKIINL